MKTAISLRGNTNDIRRLAKQGLSAEQIANALYSSTEEDVVAAVELSLSSLKLGTEFSLEQLEQDARPRALAFLAETMSDDSVETPFRIRCAEIIYKGRGTLGGGLNPDSLMDRFAKARRILSGEAAKDATIDVAAVPAAV